jgi:glycosyltransferase involved in cell wall biosynthesis
MKILAVGDKVIIIEGGSSDRSWEVAAELKSKYQDKIILLKQSGAGKFNAVREGLSSSDCSMSMIWDADATVDFEANKEIYETNLAENSLVMGDRLRGTRERGAIRPLNLIGNWSFSILWIWILHRRPIDLLCGTKKFPTNLLTKTPTKILDSDPYGDFSIIATAKKQGLAIFSIPVAYRARNYGTTNIHRWSGGVALLKLTLKIMNANRKWKSIE